MFDTGLAQFAAGRPDQTRQSLREYFGLCGPFEFLPEKSLLALKGIWLVDIPFLETSAPAVAPSKGLKWVSP